MDEVGRGTVLAGRYRLLDEQATTLPGVRIWTAWDTILARTILVRVLDATRAAAVLDAARRASLVADPRLVRVLDVGSREGVDYVVTEEAAGPSLARLVSREPLSADQARAVVGEAAAALEAARRRGVHHLALRPSAVTIAPDGRVLVSGLALDAALIGRDADDARTTSRSDAVDLIRLVYAALTGYWPGPLTTADGLPIAPQVGGSTVPPGQLVPDVPPDLDTLCAVTFGPYADGPHTPAEVVRELEPWGEIQVSGPDPRPSDLAMGAEEGAATVPPVPGGPPRVVRNSVRDAFDGHSTGSNRPGTPPPAVPGRNGAFPTVPATPAVVELTIASILPTPDRAQDPFDLDVDDEPGRRVTTSGIVLAVLVVVILLGLVLAVRALLSGAGSSPAPAPGASSSPAASTTVSAPPTTPGSPTSAGAAPTGVAPAILGIVSVNSKDATGEHEDLVARAIDGDPNTSWYTYTYIRDDFAGMKTGAGVALTLPQGAVVHTVTLHINGTGGNVEIRASDAANPTAGAVLASGPVQTGTFTLDPATTTSSLVIWFTQLPTTPEGLFRVELSEIELG